MGKHPVLLEPRSLTAEELESFSIASEAHADGRLDLDALSLGSRGIVQQELEQLDAQLERVVSQQYLRIAVPSYDATYEMCGTRGTLSFLGSTLIGSSTSEALRPIRRRLMLWPTLVIALSVAAAMLAASAMGSSAYFGPSNKMVATLWLSAAILSVPWAGALLRSWRPVIKIHGLRTLEVALGLVWALLLLAIPVVGSVYRPTIAKLEDAIAAGDIDRARLVLDAFVEREGDSSILELEDAVLLAEADAAEGSERLAKLDAIVAHDGTRAGAATALAREDRLATIRGYLSEGLADSAIAAIDDDFAASWRDDSEISEERARAEELRGQRCSDDPCRFTALGEARRAHETPERVAALEQLRAKLLGPFSVVGIENTLTPAQRVHQSNEVTQSADRLLAARLEDEALTAAASAAKVWAAEQRAAVAMFGAQADTLRALFPNIRESTTKTLAVSVEEAELFFNMDKDGVCRGIYAVGPRGHRELDGSEWSAQRILSQAFGRSESLIPRAKVSDLASTWTLDKTKIVARWRGETPIELRIGNAEP